MKKISALLAVFLILFASCGGGKLEEGAVARVNKTNIPQEDFDREVNAFKKQYEAQGQFLTEADLAGIKPKLLDSLVVKQLLLEQAEKMEISADTEGVQGQIDMFKQQFPSEEEFETSLEQNGFSIESLTEELEWQSVLQVLFDQEVADKSQVSEEEVRAFYDDNMDSYFIIPESVECSHILIMVNEEQSEEAALARITDIKAEIDNGLDFGEAAATYSEGPTKEKQGLLGNIARGQTVPAFEEAAFNQDVGQVGDPVLSQFGYHLILVHSKNEEGVTPFEEVQELIKQQLEQQAYEEGTMTYIEDLREEADILLPEWATADAAADAAVAAPAQG